MLPCGGVGVRENTHISIFDHDSAKPLMKASQCAAVKKLYCFIEKQPRRVKEKYVRMAVYKNRISEKKRTLGFQC